MTQQAKANPQALAKSTPKLPEKYADLQIVRDRVDEIQAFLQFGLLKKGIDYGKIPGTKKPSILKPGCELLCNYYRIRYEFEEDDKGTDFEAGIFRFRTTCKGWYVDKDTGERIYAGMGKATCSSLEGKYKYRWLATWDLPLKWAELYKKDPKLCTEQYKTEFGEASVKFKKNKSGKLFPQFRTLNDNPWDLENTILKMSCNRSLRAMVLYVTGTDRIFLTEEDAERLGISLLPDEDDFTKAGDSEVGDVSEGEVTEIKEPEQPKEDMNKLFMAGVNGIVKQLGWVYRPNGSNPNLESFTNSRFPGHKHPLDLDAETRKRFMQELSGLLQIR